jgi:hypothetical protein
MLPALFARRAENYLAFAPALLETYRAISMQAEDVSPGPSTLLTKSPCSLEVLCGTTALLL